MTRIPRVARQTSFFPFPHINNSRTRYGESSKGPKTHHPTHHQPGRSWLYTLRARLSYTDIAHGHSPDIPIIALKASSYPILASPIHAGPDIMQGCPPRKALSGRTWHNIRPDYATQSRTVLHHRDTDRITPSMPYHDPHSENQKDSKMSHPLYGQLPILPYLSASFTSALPLHIDTR